MRDSPPPVARDVLLEVWLRNAPLCTVWPDWLKEELAALNAVLDLAERIREAVASFCA
jgi:hypothetical protein